MNNLAVSYAHLGRHNEALAMRESVLEFRRRVLPENHPDIGEGHVRSGDACALLNCARDAFTYDGVQARPCRILPHRILAFEGTTKRLR
jgi:hypothetical protein